MSYYKINTILTELINKTFNNIEIYHRFNLSYLIKQSSFLSSKELKIIDYFRYHQSCIYIARILRNFEKELSYDYYINSLRTFIDISCFKDIVQYNRKDIQFKANEIASSILYLLEYINNNNCNDEILSFFPNGILEYIIDILDEVGGYISEKKANYISILLYEFHLIRSKENYNEKALEFLSKQMIVYGEKSVDCIDLDINAYEISGESKYILSAIQKSIKVLDHMRIRNCIRLINDKNINNDNIVEIHKLLGISIVECDEESLEKAKMLIRSYERDNKKLLSLVNQDVSNWLY